MTEEISYIVMVSATVVLAAATLYYAITNRKLWLNMGFAPLVVSAPKVNILHPKYF